MKRNLTLKESIFITSMLFGMFFGAGNLIFPAKLGIDAGSNMLFAYAGMFLTAVGLPLLAVVALGISRTNSVLELSGKVSKPYSKFFTTLLYLTIGPLFAVPRCASTSFSVGAVNLISGDPTVPQIIFSLVFFVIVFLLSYKKTNSINWIGKILNPVFLVFLAVLVVAALINPIDPIASTVPTESYETGLKAFFTGLLEGYNTLDALAGLAFGIVVIDVVRQHGISQPDRIAANTASSGISSCLMMGVIYFFITLVATQSSSVCAGCADGGAVLGTIANHYFHSVGAILMTLIVTLACLKTAIGLVTSCGETFCKMFPKGPSYVAWCAVFSIVSFLIASLGLSVIISFCVPVLMFIYPLAITLILLTLFGKYFGFSRHVYGWVTGFTLVAAVLDFCKSLASTLQASGVASTALLDGVAGFAEKYLPLYSLGFGWVCPSLVGLVIGLLLYFSAFKKTKA